ncbi:MAG: uroporphyrinogen-III synthase, partial [bacterium]|nr:uroporphyrinogen-III synthase [bacterium]
ILLPRATEAREILPRELRKLGARVVVVPAYRTVKPDCDTGKVRRMLEQGTIDMLTFTSSSTVRNFAEMFEADEQIIQQWITRVTVACIGPITAKTAERKGFSVNLIPPEYTIESLSDSIVKYYE